jgi:Bacteriophage Mu, GemA protein
MRHVVLFPAALSFSTSVVPVFVNDISFDAGMVENICMKRTTKKQKQIIHILEQQLIRKGLLDEGGYRLMLGSMFGRDSSRDLSHEEGSELIDQLVQMGGAISWVPEHGGRGQHMQPHRYGEESSIDGLRREVIRLARERYGDDFERPFRALCRRFNVDDYSLMDVRHAKAIKEALERLQEEGPYRKGSGGKTEEP